MFEKSGFQVEILQRDPIRGFPAIGEKILAILRVDPNPSCRKFRFVGKQQVANDFVGQAMKHLEMLGLDVPLANMLISPCPVGGLQNQVHESRLVLQEQVRKDVAGLDGIHGPIK